MINSHAYSIPSQDLKPTNITPIRPVRAVNEQQEADYVIDGVPVQRGRDTVKEPSRHVTMIEDSVLDEVAFTCGMAATGLYAILERRVGRDGVWICRIADLGAAFDQNDRHVRAAIGVLEEAGFLYRETVYGRGGVPSGVRFTLPKHMRTYDPVVTPEADPEPTPEVHHEVTPEPHAPVLGVVVTSSYEVDTSKEGIAPVVPTGDAPAKPPRRRPSHPIPDDFTLTDERRAYAIGKGFDDARVDIQFERFVNHAKANDRRQVDWDRSWQNWILGDVQRNGTSPPQTARTSSNGVGRHTLNGKDIGYSNEELDYFIEHGVFPNGSDHSDIIETQGVVR